MIARPTQELLRNILHMPLALGNEWQVIYQKLDRTLIFRAYHSSIMVDDVDDDIVKILPHLNTPITPQKLIKVTKIDKKKVLSLITFLLQKGILGGVKSTLIFHEKKLKNTQKTVHGMSIWKNTNVIGIIETNDGLSDHLSRLLSTVKKPISVYIYSLGNKSLGQKTPPHSSSTKITYLHLNIQQCIDHIITHRVFLLGQSASKSHNMLINKAVLSHSLSWMPFSIDHSEAKGYMGPLTKNQSNACYKCFFSRYTEGKTYHKDDVLIQRKVYPSLEYKRNLTQKLAIYIVNMLYDAKLMERLLTDHAFIIDLFTNKKKRHYLLKKYSCNHNALNSLPPSSLHLRSRKTKSSENGLRTRTADEVFMKGRRLMGELGIVTSLKKIEKKNTELNITTYRSISANPLGKQNEEYARVHFGKGLTDIQNRNSALLEGIERYCSKIITYKKCVYASYLEVSDKAVNPQLFTLPNNIGYSDSKKLHWVWGYSLTTMKRVLLPLMLITIPNSIATTSGIASGNTREEALLHGIFEVIERDAVYILELNTLSMPDVQIGGVVPFTIASQLALLTQHDISYSIKYITNTIEVPVFQVYLRGLINGRVTYGYGVGAHLVKEIALTRAITEALQSYPTFSDADWIKTRPLNHYTDRGNKLLKYEDIPSYTSNNILDHIYMSKSLLEKNHMEVFLVDMVKEPIDFSVVRVLISGVQPAMTSRYPRISPRVTDVPPLLGLKARKKLKMGYFPGFAYYPITQQRI